MTARLAGLKRLVGLYAAIDRMHTAELQRATASVNEVRTAIEGQQQIVLSASLDSRSALMADDGMGRRMAETEREGAEWRRRRLDVVHAERRSLKDAAMEQYAASRLKNEQVKQIVEKIGTQIEDEKKRRTQSESDDRFLARRRWTDLRERMQSDGSMNIS